jgi:hypothetical protein
MIAIAASLTRMVSSVIALRHASAIRHAGPGTPPSSPEPVMIA